MTLVSDNDKLVSFWDKRLRENPHPPIIPKNRQATHRVSCLFSDIGL